MCVKVLRIFRDVRHIRFLLLIFSKNHSSSLCQGCLPVRTAHCDRQGPRTGEYPQVPPLYTRIRFFYLKKQPNYPVRLPYLTHSLNPGDEPQIPHTMPKEPDAYHHDGRVHQVGVAIIYLLWTYFNQVGGAGAW